MKRTAAEESDSDDDFGPMPASASVEEDAAVKINQKPSKRTKTRRLMHEQLYVDNLPNATQYEKSYMHRDTVTHVAVAKTCDFLLTGSCDGHVKFWKKMPLGLEFVKHFQVIFCICILMTLLCIALLICYYRHILVRFMHLWCLLMIKS